MSLKTRITDDMKAALKARQSQRLSAIRLLLAAIQQKEIDERKDLSDGEAVGVVEKLIKQRRDSIAQFQAANRSDLADAETFELGVLSSYLPKQVTDAEVTTEVDNAVLETGAKSLADMGKVMGALKVRLAGKADMSKVSALVRAKLGAGA